MQHKGLAIIVGASQGIGKCVAEGLAQDGYQAVLIARNGAKLEQLAESISAKGARPLIYPLDICDHAAVAKVAREIIDLGKPIDVIVNCAAAYVKGTLSEEVSEVRRILETNLLGHYTLLQLLVPVLKEQRNGCIFTIASRAGKHGFPGVGIYGASKSALIGLSESLYRELAPMGVKVTTLCPGVVNTEMATATGTPLTGDAMIQPDDILQAIRFLLRLSKNACVKELVMESPATML